MGKVPCSKREKETPSTLSSIFEAVCIIELPPEGTDSRLGYMEGKIDETIFDPFGMYKLESQLA